MSIFKNLTFHLRLVLSSELINPLALPMVCKHSGRNLYNNILVFWKRGQYREFRTRTGVKYNAW